MNILKHLACIMDGNRRWAYARGMPAIVGHRQGIHAVKRVVQFCRANAIAHVSFYLFSIENLQRSAEEKNYLYAMIVNEAENFIADAQKQGICVRFIGDRSLFSAQVCDAIDHIEEATRMGMHLTVDLLFCYGGQQEIVHAVQEIGQAIERKELCAHEITHELFQRYLWTHPMLPPDLIIRTGGFQRLSGFHLYHAAYAELRFLDCLWPDLDDQQLQAVVDDFYHCQRRYGI